MVSLAPDISYCPNNCYHSVPPIALLTVFISNRLAAYLESEPERIKARQEAQRAKLDKLERRLGIDEDGKAREEGSSAGAKRRFDDTEYIEQSKDIVDNVKSAVTAGKPLLFSRFIFRQRPGLTHTRDCLFE